ncbi:MAG: hypothetical protein IKV32_03065 [Muribaculaceae bacterium]|nr:hypothetical protein [Muribaculaceae bacterium]
MKKIILSLALLTSFCVNAQVLNVNSTTKVNVPSGTKVSTAQLSHSGEWVVISHQTTLGLDKIDLATSKVSHICDNGIGFDLKISSDDNTVIFRESNYGTDKHRYTTLKSVNIANGATQVVSPATRDTRAFAGATAKTLKANAGSINASAALPVASINRGSMYITKNGVTTLVAPQGVEGKSYLWPQVSPDGKKILYFVVGEGCFVCNIDGSNPVAQGVLRASVWYDNNIIVGMDHKDDGVKTTSSKLIAKNINSNTTQVLTSTSVKAMYPSTGNGKISFVTPEGELFLLNVSK